VEKYSKAKHATDGYTKWRMLTARWTIEATNTNSDYLTLFVLLNKTVGSYSNICGTIAMGF
jgi:hypothetical protein